MTKETSDAQHIFKVLMAHGVGHKFTFSALKQELEDKHYKFSEGSITGIMSRLVKKGNIEVKGKITNPSTMLLVRQYVIVNTEEWSFHSRGIGSYPGRGGYTLGPKEEYQTINEFDQDIINEFINNKNTVNELKNTKESIDISKIFKLGSIGEQLIKLSVKVCDLENKPQKSIKDFTTDELIEEIKSRLK